MVLACCITGRRCISSEVVDYIYKYAMARTLRYIVERHRMFIGRCNVDVAVVVGGHSNVYEVEAQCMIAERGLPLRQNLVPGWAKEKTLDQVMEQFYPDFEVKQTQVHGKKGVKMGKGLFTKVALKKNDYINVFAWGELLDDRVTKQSVHASDIKFGARQLRNLVMRVSYNCPLRWVNDHRGTKKKTNICLVEMDATQMDPQLLDQGGLVRAEVPFTIPLVLFFFFVCLLGLLVVTS
jgi:hypothetical protein